MTIDKHTTIGDLAANMPGATAAFQALKIDFCCGGKHPLLEALAERNVSLEAFLADARGRAAARREGRDQDFTQMSSATLTRYNEDTHHDYLRRALPDIDELFLRVLGAHGANHPELFEVYKKFGLLATELKQHLIKEETLLFPPYFQSAAPQRALAEEIVREHEAAGELLEAMRALTNDYAVPADACMTYRRVYEMLPELEGDLHQHIHLENNILLKQ